MYNIYQKTGIVVEIKKKYPEKQILKIKIEKNIEEAINYTQITGKINTGDRVLLNTTAVELGLGTGGYHFVICNLSKPAVNNTEKNNNHNKKQKGHIMKMRYSPYQIKVLAVEEPESPYHQKIKNFNNLQNQPVVIIPLHSLLAPLAITFKECYPNRKLVYIMTEGGCLPLELSNTVFMLKRKGYIDNTITVGHTFGGDLEAVNIYTGLAAAREAANADLIIAGMGPGLAGTETTLGFSGMENIFINYAVDVLNGRSIFVPRISLAEKRKRHYLLSHHTITILKYSKQKADLVFPDKKVVKKYLNKIDIVDSHNIFYYDIIKVKNILNESNINFQSMGRSFEEDPLFFITAGLAVYRYRDLIEE